MPLKFILKDGYKKVAEQKGNNMDDFENIFTDLKKKYPNERKMKK